MGWHLRDLRAKGKGKKTSEQFVWQDHRHLDDHNEEFHESVEQGRVMKRETNFEASRHLYQVSCEQVVLATICSQMYEQFGTRSLQGQGRRMISYVSRAFICLLSRHYVSAWSNLH